jgi:endonuclease/exonuclease/phosphatase family metal-dependent hydrolase
MKKFFFLTAFIPFWFLSSCEQSRVIEPEKPEEEIDISACLTPVSSDALEIMTWNVKQFPIDNQRTVKVLVQIIEEQLPDIIAFQEITTVMSFNQLTDSLEGYDGQMYFSGDVNLGYIYKNSEITVDSKLRAIIEDDFFAFPREPVLLSVTHKSGIKVNLINIHLKCCDGEDNFNRRKDASEQLKEYVDTNLADEKVIILGDYNDEIFGVPDLENPFINFISDGTNYLFADMLLAESDIDNWSYPSWPSHIDHILITNELFDLVDETLILAFDDCFEKYFEIISDHRPLMIKISN